MLQSALGISQEDAAVLREQILSEVILADCTEGEFDEYGRRYTVDLDVKIGERTASVRTGWIVKTEEDFPRLTSCFAI